MSPIRPEEPLPVETVRDLLGLARGLDAVAKDRKATAQMRELEAIGRDFRGALGLARTEPGTFGHRAAWSHAEWATERLGLVMDSLTALRSVFEASARRLKSAMTEASGENTTSADFEAYADSALGTLRG